METLSNNFPDSCLKTIPDEVLERYNMYSYGHAIEILSFAFKDEWQDIIHALQNFSLTEEDILLAGGNESTIPKKFDNILYPAGWREIRITGDLTVKKYQRRSETFRRGLFDSVPVETLEIKGYIDGHNIDFVKNRVAFDLEWNSKDQTFDRDLLAIRTYFDCGIIDVGVIVTRSQSLNNVFNQLGEKYSKPLKAKYGASTTWMGKLIPRLESRRNGGCPVLAIGITSKCVTGFKPLEGEYEYR